MFNQAGKCVAIGAIKNPNPGYKAGVFNNAGVAASQQYKFELGWLYVPLAERGKGYGRELMRVISESLTGQKSYATTRENNQVMHKSKWRLLISALYVWIAQVKIIISLALP